MTPIHNVTNITFAKHFLKKNNIKFVETVIRDKRTIKLADFKYSNDEPVLIQLGNIIKVIHVDGEQTVSVYSNKLELD